MSKRRTHSPEFKAKVAMEAISGRKTLQQIAADHGVHPIQVSQWRKQLLEGASELFNSGKKSRDKDESQAKTPMTYESSLTMRIAISRSAANVNSWIATLNALLQAHFSAGIHAADHGAN
jgi:putative transposase